VIDTLLFANRKMLTVPLG